MYDIFFVIIYSGLYTEKIKHKVEQKRKKWYVIIAYFRWTQISNTTMQKTNEIIFYKQNQPKKYELHFNQTLLSTER